MKVVLPKIGDLSATLARLSRVAILLLLVGLQATVTCQEGRTHAPISSQRVAELREKYAEGAIVRDIDHIKQDLQQVIQLSGDGTFTIEESIFYLMRMHDFDNNNQLDGLELMCAFNHAHGRHEDGNAHHPQHEGESPDASLETLVPLVDDTLKHDANHDGLLSYAEWVQGYKASTPTQT